MSVDRAEEQSPQPKWRIMRRQPGPRYVHPKAAGIVDDETDHDANLDIAEESSPNYLRWIADMCEPHLGRRVLEVGAGTGSITAMFAANREVTAIDLSPWCVDQMNRRFEGAPNVIVRRADLRELALEGSTFDSVVMLNVLEHIDDDVDALRRMSALLAPGGRVVVYVPAVHALYGKWDRKVGHRRRYSRWRIREVLAAADLVEIEIRYMNMLSVPPWWVFSHSNIETSTRSKMALWDATGIRVGRRLESVVPAPIGLNLFCAAAPRAHGEDARDS